uniref:Uncharacterized protein n=1 Tax=Siphoviridae sp. ctQU013 TaxID=2826329 RepID=A0A8S5NLQ5_9CAUD|nr:MAG TPA: hypothetical protein [Siphoviridae sp. ctQU013]
MLIPALKSPRKQGEEIGAQVHCRYPLWIGYLMY